MPASMNSISNVRSTIGFGCPDPLYDTAPLSMAQQHVANLGRYYAIAIDIGAKDPFIRSNQDPHAAMMKLRIPHFYEEYDGDHINKVRERIALNVLPFFSKNLVAPANPTSPQIQP